MTDRRPTPSPLAAVERRVQQRAKELSIDASTEAGRARLREVVDQEVAHWTDQYRRGRRPLRPRRPRERRRPRLPKPRRLRPARAAARRRRRLGSDDQRPRRHLREAASRPERLPRRGLPRRRPRPAHADQDARRLVRVAPQARPRRRPAGRAARRRRPPPHRARRRRARRPRAGEHPQVHGRRLPHPRRAGRARHARRAGRRIPARLRPRPAVDRVLGRARLWQDHVALVLRRRARSRRFGSSSPKRYSKPTFRWPTSPACRPGQRGPTEPRSTSAGSSPASCAWPRTSPSSARSATERRCRSCLTLSSGVKGFTTIHAGSARQALSRLRFVCQLADAAGDLPMSALNALVSEAVDLVVHCTRADGMLRVGEIVAVEEPLTRAGCHRVHDHRAVRSAPPGRRP